jgi:hypothetical protein
MPRPETIKESGEGTAHANGNGDGAGPELVVKTQAAAE